jgi:hypothetical protein
MLSAGQMMSSVLDRGFVADGSYVTALPEVAPVVSGVGTFIGTMPIEMPGHESVLENTTGGILRVISYKIASADYLPM